MKDRLKSAEMIIQNLQAYGKIHTVKGVTYPSGTHEYWIKKADEWLWNARKKKHQ